MKIVCKGNYNSFPKEWGPGSGTIYIYIDNRVCELEEEYKGKAIALLVEPRSIIPNFYDWTCRHYDRFKYIFTFDSEMLKLPNAKLLIYGQITAEFPDDPKTKNISMVASDKKMCRGHMDRQKVAKQLTTLIDTYGKFDGGSFCAARDYLSGYRFNVAMENYSDGYYFTEKLCNCLASKTVPIYYGCPNIGEYFDTSGIIICKSPDDVIKQVKEVLKDPIGEYNKRLEAIEYNYKAVQKYRRYAPLFLENYNDLLLKLAR